MATIQRQIPYTPKAPVRKGIYSVAQIEGVPALTNKLQAVVVDRTVYISGQLGLDVSSGQLVEGGVQAQAKQALVNMGEILKAAGCDYSNVVKTTVLLADINDFNSVNEVYKTCKPLTLVKAQAAFLSYRAPINAKPQETFPEQEKKKGEDACDLKPFFSSNFPARAAYQVAALPRGGLVEIEAVAVAGPLLDS